MLEKLHGPLVFRSSGAGFEGSEVSSLVRLWVNLSRVKTILSRFEFANHLHLQCESEFDNNDSRTAPVTDLGDCAAAPRDCQLPTSVEPYLGAVSGRKSHAFHTLTDQRTERVACARLGITKSFRSSADDGIARHFDDDSTKVELEIAGEEPDGVESSAGEIGKRRS